MTLAKTYNGASPYITPEPSEVSNFINALAQRKAKEIEGEFRERFPDATFEMMFPACLADVIDDNVGEFIRSCSRERRE